MFRDYCIVIVFLGSYLTLCGQQQISNDSIRDEVKVITQLIEDHKAQVDSLSTLLAEISLDEQDSIVQPFWSSQLNGIFGFDFNRFSNWVGRGDDVNSISSSISSTLSGRVSLKKDDIFWINRAHIALGWQRFENMTQNFEIQRTADLFNLSSHFGTNLSDDIALSFFGEWRTQLIDPSIAPSYLDLSIGATWTPTDYFMMTLHPLNYELVLSNRDQFLSSLGAKLIVNYDHKINDSVTLTSNLNGFVSYRDLSMLSNYTWTNGVNIKLLNSLGLGIEYAIRISRQETNALSISNDLQSYLVMGLSYVL